MRYAMVAATVLAAGCMTAARSEEPVRSQVEVRMVGATREQAMERIKAVFVSEGLVVQSADGGIVKSMPAPDQPAALTAMLVRYQALTLADSAGVRVVLTGTYQLQNVQAMQQAMTGIQTANPPQPLRSDMRSRLGFAWQKLETMAARLSTS